MGQARTVAQRDMIEAQCGRHSAAEVVAMFPDLGLTESGVTAAWIRGRRAGRLAPAAGNLHPVTTLRAIEALHGGATADEVTARFPGLTPKAVRAIWCRAKNAGRIGSAKAEGGGAEEVRAGNATVRLGPVLECVAGAALAVAQAEIGSCRWPSGDPREGDFQFCGAVVERPTIGPAGVEKVNCYCEAHRMASRGARVMRPIVAERHKAPMFGLTAPNLRTSTQRRFAS